MKTLLDLFRQTWCRIAYGHLMVNLGSTDDKTLYMCNRCLRVESLEKLV
jgi:hypothetical protein